MNARPQWLQRGGVSAIVPLNLVMPMAVRQSRFAKRGERKPDPLIEIEGRPFFWWAAESVRRSAKIGEMVFVVLADHISEFGIDGTIRRFYPLARIVPVDEVPADEAQGVSIGVDALETSGPFAVNGYDHAFEVENLDGMVDQLERRAANGALIGFRSTDPELSYVMFEDGKVAGTADNEVASRYAIANCYFLADKQDFIQRHERYRRDWPDTNLRLNGLFDVMAMEGLRVGRSLFFMPATKHVRFGTPEELAALTPASLSFIKTGF